jgi:hypothetical protein
MAGLNLIFIIIIYEIYLTLGPYVDFVITSLKLVDIGYSMASAAIAVAMVATTENDSCFLYGRMKGWHWNCLQLMRKLCLNPKGVIR